jgi:ActR/RegA family two-component response regulator
MYIQYTGFKATLNARVYSFHVLDPGRGQRDFTVEIQSDTNHWASLKLQDGPGICFERLERELARETPAADAELSLQISDADIHDYLKHHYPPVKTYGPKAYPETSGEDLDVPAIASVASGVRRIVVSEFDSMQEEPAAILLHKAGATTSVLKQALENASIQVRWLATLQEAVPLLRGLNPPHLVFTEAMLPDGTWADVVKQASLACKPVKVIVVSRVTNVSLYVEAIEGGALDFIVPPLAAGELAHVVKSAVENVLALRQSQPVAV